LKIAFYKKWRKKLGNFAHKFFEYAPFETFDDKRSYEPCNNNAKPFCAVNYMMKQR